LLLGGWHIDVLVSTVEYGCVRWTV